MNTETRTNDWILILSLLALAPACSSGGGGGGGGGGGSASAAKFGAITGSGYVASVDPRSGEAQLDLGGDPSGLRSPIGAALDSRSGTLYTIDGDRGVLVRIDEDSGEREVVGEVGDLSPGSLAWASEREALFGVVRRNPRRQSPSSLVTVDIETGATTAVGDCAAITCLAYDETTRMLYGVAAQSLYRIEPANGFSEELFTSVDLTNLVSLVRDPVAGVFYGVRGDTLVEFDLGGTFAAPVTLDEELLVLALNQRSGELVGFTAGRELVELVGEKPDVTLDSRAVLGCNVVGMTFDPVDGEHFAFDVDKRDLVKLDPATGTSRVIGSLAGHDVKGLVYDPVRRLLYASDGSSDEMLEIDPVTAEATVLTPLNTSLVLAIDPVAGTIYGYSEEFDVTLSFDPDTLSAPHTSGRLFLNEVRDLTFDPTTGNLVGSWVEPGRPAAGEGKAAISAWHPQSSGPAVRELEGQLRPFHGLSLDSTTGLFAGFVDGQPLYEIDLHLRGLEPVDLRTTSLMQRSYVAAVHVPSRDIVYAIDSAGVYELDPSTGESQRIGNYFGAPATDVLWDEARAYLGVRSGSTITWVLPVIPARDRASSSLGPWTMGRVARNTVDGFLYGVYLGILYRLDLSDPTNPRGFQVTPGQPSGIEATGMTYVSEAGAFYVTTADRDIYRVDPGTGEWKEEARTTHQLLAVFDR